MAAVTWRPVEPDESLGGVLAGVERAAAAPPRGEQAGQQASGVSGVRRFRSAEGGSAILVPANLVGVVSADRSWVLVVDPPDVGSALALLAQLGPSAGPVMIAVPVGASAQETAGLVAQPGRICAGPEDTAVEFVLYAATDRTASDRRLASGPRPGEDPDTLNARARWFDSRHG